ncbi:3-oxoacyl-ACP synthase [Lampropedia puyangensis]|uniref:3-oxoacyl-ACP synthase n=1 Tax=Lampropedia puyangensis TaxID=1330072 RepID=A0A4S8F8J4_9BURK|nr:beta-ketoacyl synthase chain length factor [Lampropedia puyangensis]THU02574.1 3-oxoacyl-ACP synthase [Lampropedia puyangensis]
MSLSIAVVEWAAYAQSLISHEDWLNWSRAGTPSLAPLEEAPPLTRMNAMLRRRASLTGRLACETAYGALHTQAPHPWNEDCAMVFATRYGDAQKSLALLSDLVVGNPLSPTGFGLAVHNAAGALFAMAQTYRNNMTVVTAGIETTKAAFIESLGLLAAGAPEVLLVSYDLPLPHPYQSFNSTPGHAWAMRIKLPPKKQKDALAIRFLKTERAHRSHSITTPSVQQATPSIEVLRQWLDCQTLRSEINVQKTLWI